MDYSDNEVKGLPRYFPDTLSKSLAVSLVAVPSGLYISAPESVLALLPDQAITKIPLSLLVLSLGLGLCIAIGLIVHLALILNHSKHKRIRHATFHSQSMDIVNLVKHFTLVHYSFLMFIFITGVITGYLL